MSLRLRTTSKRMSKPNMDKAMKRITGELAAIILAMPDTGRSRPDAFRFVALLDNEIRQLWEPVPDPEVVFVPLSSGMKGPVDG